MDNLTFRQLRAPAELRLYNKERLGSHYEVEEDTDRVDQATMTVPAPILVPEYTTWLKDRRNQSKLFVPQWEKGADYAVVPPKYFPPSDYSKFQQKSIIQIFEEFIDDEYIEHLVAETRKYALFLNCPDPNITPDEIRCFIAILFVSGYNNLPSKRH